MKKNDENQNNDSGMTRRVYKKASLDDTVVNVRKDPSDDFDLLSDDGMMDYVPGVDDVDHFDFDEKDIEHYRKVNEQEAAERDRRRKQRALEKQRTAQKQQCETKKSDEQPQGKRQNKQAAKAVADEVPVKKTNTKKKKRRRRKDEETDIDDIELRRELSEKKRTNKEIMRITYVMMLLFFGMIGYFIYFDGVTSKEVINNPHNSRLAKMADSVVRGEILSADGEVLAESIKDDNGNYYRYYPYGCTFAHVVGTSDVNKSGVELTADYNLITSDIQPVEKIINEIRGQKNPADNVVTTLDANLQQVAHDALGDREGAVVAIEPSTGKVLAMISKPDYDPNSLVDNYQDIISDENSKVLLNQSTQGLFVPGSIFKMVTSLAYLRSGGDPDNYSYYCDGSISLQSDSGDSYIKCYDGEEHGQVDLLESFAESCNASFANLGLSISVDKMNEVANSLLFNQTLPTKFTTAKSQFSLSNTDSQWQIGATAIGQGNTVISPIHAAMLVSAIANGGTLMKPYVIDSVQSTEGSVIEQYESENNGTLMSTSESSQLTKMMKAVVEEGTGYKLSGKNYSVAGKTGTAEVVGRGNNAWFVGFAPADDPKIAICVLVEDAGTASSEAVPIAGEILDAYLNN
ncbi:MAG: penicillin-binding transpeptidase domain-containing protein [Coprococcus sp.]